MIISVKAQARNIYGHIMLVDEENKNIYNMDPFIKASSLVVPNDALLDGIDALFSDLMYCIENDKTPEGLTEEFRQYLNGLKKL